MPDILIRDALCLVKALGTITGGCWGNALGSFPGPNVCGKALNLGGGFAFDEVLESVVGGRGKGLLR